MKIHELAGRGDLAGVQRELDSGVHVDVRDPRTNFTPLAEAASSADGTPDVLQLLLERGADPNALCGDKRQDSVLLLAVKTWDLDRLATLLDAGADIYNDVVVYDGERGISIYGYPASCSRRRTSTPRRSSTLGST